MIRYLSTVLFLIIGFVTSCSQAPESKKLIDETNAAKVKARQLASDAGRKWNQAKEKNESGDQAEHDRLIEEAAKLYGQSSETFEKAASTAKELAKLNTPAWYAEYFGLQSRLMSNLAELAAGARDELLTRNASVPSDSEIQSKKDNLKRINEENEKLRKQIAAIESRQDIVLIKE